MRAKLARCHAEQVGPANIGHEADPRFRHRQNRAFGDDTVGGMTTKADTPAHHGAVHQRHHRFGETGNAAVQAIFVGEKFLVEVEGSGF